ncbi:MAG: hypothetical protein FK733_03875 [Asgard group archaeon]|nr:hypothetical protein [Asgard group archaeon]
MHTRKSKKADPSEEIIEEEPYDPQEEPPAIIAHGASSTKIGLGGEKFPRYVYPEQSSDLAARIRRFPIDGDKITNEELLRAYWDAGIKQLNLKHNEKALLISLPTADLTICPFRDNAQEYFYNQIENSKIIVVSDPFLSLVGFLPQTRKLTGIIVDIGLSQIRIVPFFEAAIIEESITQVSFGGFELTLQLGTWLQKMGYNGPIDALFVRDIKENYCYVRGKDQVVEETTDNIISYHLGQKSFVLSSERWKLPELLFFKKFFTQKVITTPRSDSEGNKFDLNNLSLSIAIANAIKSMNFRLWPTLCQNICLTGGGAKFPGLKGRLLEELTTLLPDYKKSLKIHTVPEPALMPYIGASKLVMLNSFQKYWRDQEEFTTGEYQLFL